jgi:hypothetical protein
MELLSQPSPASGTFIPSSEGNVKVKGGFRETNLLP